MKKHIRKPLSMLLCIALLLASFVTAQPILASEASTQTENASSVVTQPDVYTLPITHEDGMQPIQSVTATLNDSATDYTYTATAGFTTDEDEALSGKVSLKISTETVNSGETDGVIESLCTNYFTVAGDERLTAEKVVSGEDGYAYLKMRIKVPENEDGSDYKFYPVIRSNNRRFVFNTYNAKVFNADGTANSDIKVTSAAAKTRVTVPSGFDGYLYLSLYRLRDSNTYLADLSTTAYTSTKYADPTLENDFEMYFDFLQTNYNLDNAEILIDNIGFVFSGDYQEEMPYNFDEITYSLPTAKGYNSAWYSLSNITYYTGKNALNGDASMLVDIQDIRSTNEDGTVNYFSYNYVDFDEQNGVTDANVGGVMVRLKLLNDTTTGTGKKAHAMYLALEQSDHASTCVGGNAVKLFDAYGNPVPTSDYATDYMNLYVPSGFDGFIFFPFSSLARRVSTSTADLVNIANNFDMRIWFVTPKNWSGVDAVIDDVSLYNVQDSTVGLTETDALKTMKSLGYDVELPTPEFYDLAFDYEDLTAPMDSIVSRYGQLNGDGKYPNETTEAEFVTDDEALSGNVSLKYNIPRISTYEEEGRSFVRATSTESTFDGIAGLDKESIANNAENYAYLTMRVKVPTGAEDGGYQFNVYAKQDGVAKSTRLRAEYGYTVDGEYVEFTVKDGVTTLPAGFDGTIYMPFKKATSESTLTSGMRAMYGNSYTAEDGTVLYGSDFMVDFSQQFDMYLYLGDTDWADTVLYVDDIQIKHFKPVSDDSNVSWFFDAQTGTLEIIGAGAIPDYSASNVADWAYCNYAVKEVKIGLGITAIGAEAFKDFYVLEKVTMRTTVTSIGSKAFAGCTALAEIDIPKTVETIAEDAFDKTIVISCYEGSYAEEFADLNGYETDHPVTLKVLGIGNSFTMNAFRYIAELTQAVGVEDYTLGRMYYGGRTLQEHYEHTQSAPNADDVDDYEYYEYSNETLEWVCETSKSIAYGLKAHDWDIIILQGSSKDGEKDYNSNGALDGLFAYVNENKTNPNAEFGWYGTWSCWREYIVDEGDRVENSYNHYKIIMENVNNNITPREEFKYFIPAGTVLQTLRNTYMTDYETNNQGDKYYDFLVDEVHLNTQGMYIAGLTWVRTLTGISVDDLTYNPVFSEEDFALVKTAVNAAMENPYDISVAMLNGKYYTALSDAVNAAEAGDTVTLIGNSDETVAYDKDITVIGGNHEVSGVVYSDYNGDQKTDILDFIRIKRHLADPENISVENGKGDIENTADTSSMTLLQKILLGVTEFFTK